MPRGLTPSSSPQTAGVALGRRGQREWRGLCLYTISIYVTCMSRGDQPQSERDHPRGEQITSKTDRPTLSVRPSEKSDAPQPRITRGTAGEAAAIAELSLLVLITLVGAVIAALVLF